MWRAVGGAGVLVGRVWGWVCLPVVYLPACGVGRVDIEKRPPMFLGRRWAGCAVGVLAGGYSVGLSVWALWVR